MEISNGTQSRPNTSSRHNIPANLAEAFQRANSYQLGHGKTPTGTVADNLLQIVFASDVSSDPQNKKHKYSRKTIPREEWLRMTKEQQDAVKAKNKARTKCEYCDKPGHTESECRRLKSATAELKKENAKKSVAFITATPAEVEEDREEPFEAVYVHSTETVMHNQYNPLCEDLVLCDYCASASIFRNKNLLTNLIPSGTITFTGVGGSIDVTQQGDFGVFGTVAYDERATFNVILVDSLPKSSVVTYDHAARCHTIIIRGEVFDCKVPYGKKGLPVRRFSHALPSPHPHILANTVAQDELLYSKREVDEAKQARKLSRMLAFPSFEDISEAISSGTLIDCPVTIRSLKRAIDIYGMQDNILKGRTTHTTTPHDKIVTVTRPPGNDVRLDGDIFFIEGIAFLLTFSTPINLLGVTALANRTVNTISKALE